jgi:hypothetical protein
MQEKRTIDLIRNPELLDSNTVDILRRKLMRYPYYQTLRLLLLENLYNIHSPEFNDELRQSSLFLADRGVLFNLIEGKNYEIEPQTTGNDEVGKTDEDRTLVLIDEYLGDIPTETTTHKISAHEAATDYAGYLIQKDAEEKQNPYSSSDDDKDEVVVQHKPERKVQPAGERRSLSNKPDEELVLPEAEEPAREEFFTETLAQIYIKQHKYERALEIIKVLNLNNPKKSSYFADQIRFLEKLIQINKNKNQDNV